MDLKEKAKYFLQGMSSIGEGFYRIGEGFSRMFSLFPETSDYKHRRNLEESAEDAFRKDGEALRRDWETIGKDLKRVFGQFEK